MEFHLLCIFPSVSLEPPGLTLCPETLNIHISIILIFKSIKWIAPDKTNSNYLCGNGEIYLVWWVTAVETWGWMSAALPLLFLFLCLLSCLLFFFFDHRASLKASLYLKENRWRSLWRVFWKRDIQARNRKWRGRFHRLWQQKNYKRLCHPLDCCG